MFATKFWRRENSARRFKSRFAKALKVFGYERIRQDGSPIRVTTQVGGQHHLTIPNHRSLKIGTLKSIFRLVAAHHRISVEAVMEKLA